MPPRAVDYARAHRRRFLEELIEFVRFPSVSAQTKHRHDLENCARWLARQLERIGLQNVRVLPPQRHPIVYGEWLGAPRNPTILIYGHYDVQPADPFREWVSPPFEPTLRGQDLYGRGACDDKGQMFIFVKGLESYLRAGCKLPVNVKCLFEGEEEIGSPSLRRFVTRNKRALAADAAILSDAQMPSSSRPAIIYSLRGALGLEIELRGQGHDLHSGNFGGAVHNPLQALAEIVGSLHDSTGRIGIPGIYKRVRYWSDAERAYMGNTGPSDANILRDAQAEKGWGEPGFTLYERTTIRPALTVNGLVGGYQGPGGKAVIPSRALAKLSFRLVADQDPREVDLLVRRHIARITPPTIRSAVRTLSASRPALISTEHPAMRAAALALRKAFGAAPVFLRSGGTIPVIGAFQEALRVPSVLIALARPDDRIHAPNERFHLPNFYKGIEAFIWFLAAMGASKRPSSEPNRGLVLHDH